jgi:hypothetical protein
MQKLETILKRFETPDEVRTFEKGKFELVHIGGMSIGRATAAIDDGTIHELNPGPATALGITQSGHKDRSAASPSPQ